MLFIVIHGQALWRSLFICILLSSVGPQSLSFPWLHSFIKAEHSLFRDFFFFFTGVGSLVFEPHSCLTVIQLAFLSTTLLSVKWGQHIPSQLVPGLATRMEVALGNWQTLCIYPCGVLWAGDPCDIMSLHEGGISGSALLEGSLGSVWTPVWTPDLTRLQLTALTSHSKAVAT